MLPRGEMFHLTWKDQASGQVCVVMGRVASSILGQVLVFWLLCTKGWYVESLSVVELGGRTPVKQS